MVAHEPAHARPEQSTTVMIVEDDRPLRSTLAVTLTMAGFEVLQAGTGEEALALGAVQVPDLFLLDLSLPGIDGLEVLARLRSTTTVPIVVLTVREAKHDKIAALDRGADDYVVKPIDADELIARIRAALRRHPGRPSPRVVRAGDIEFDRAARRVVARDSQSISPPPSSRCWKSS